jgi:hypothetical protein
MGTTRAAMAALLALGAASRLAVAHDPLEATAIVQIEDEQLTLQMTLGSWRASRACGRTPFDACARSLYRVVSGGEALRARSSEAALRPDGDVALTIVYPPPRGERLQLTAVHLQRHPEEMTGASLMVQRDDQVLVRRLLGADDATVEIELPLAPRSKLAAIAKRSSILLAAAAMLGWLVWCGVHRRRSVTSVPASVPVVSERGRPT